SPAHVTFSPCLPWTVSHPQHLGQPGKPGLVLSYLRIGFGRQGQTIRPKYLCPCGTPASQASLYLGYAFLPWPLSGTRRSIPRGQCPPSYGRPSCYPECKPLLGAEGYEGLCPLVGQGPLPAELMEPGRKE